jgi:hypothetical protein
MLDSWAHDVRYAVRLLRRNPISAATAALSIAIGIGANTTIFTIANALLFRSPAGVADPGRLIPRIGRLVLPDRRGRVLCPSAPRDGRPLLPICQPA